MIPDQQLLDWLEEHRALRVQSQHVVEDEHPAVLRGYQIEDDHIDTAHAVTPPGMAGLLRYALARSSMELWGGEVLRGERPYPDPETDLVDIALPVAWNVVRRLDEIAATEAAVFAALSDWVGAWHACERALEAAGVDDAKAVPAVERYSSETSELLLRLPACGMTSAIALAIHAVDQYPSDTITDRPAIDWREMRQRWPEHMLIALISGLRAHPQIAALLDWSGEEFGA